MTPILAVSLALVPITAASCLLFARFMRHRAIGQLVRETGPRSHTPKAGTPTMGGLVLVGLWIVAVVCLQPWRPDTRSIAFVLTAGTLYGGIGWLDDWLSIRKRHSTGLSVVQKLGLATLASFLLYFSFAAVVAAPVAIPFTSLTVTLPPVAVFFVTWLVFVATTNSLNLADGLDGLAGGLALLIVCGLLVLAPTRGHLLLGFPLIAALLGFLWTNVHPAALFLGDVGSFAIGGIIAALALASGLSFVLPLLAGVLVLEAAAVLLQVSLFRLTGKRLFKMAPLHHHFEAAVAPQERKCLIRSYEWPETKVTARFLILQALFIAVAVWAGSFPKV